MGFTGFDQRRILTLAGTIVLAGAVVAAGIYGPSAWKVLRHQGAPPEQVVIQNPPVDGNISGAANQGANNLGTGGGTNAQSANTGTKAGSAAPAATQVQDLSTTPQGDKSGPKKYKEPDTKAVDLAPSIAGFFAGSETGLSDSAKTLAFSAAWNIHQYVDGYLYGPTAGPQMNEQDIKKYIVFHKALWDKQIKSEPGATKAAVFSDYMDVLLNRGADAFDAKDKTRIEQYHQEIHDLDSHLFRNDPSAKIYGATPFATKR